MPDHYSYSDIPASWRDVSATELVAVPADKHPLSVCVLTGKVGQAIADLASDPDQVPEIEKLNGTGYVECTMTEPLLAPHFPDGPISIRPRRVDFVVVDSVFMRNGAVGVALIAGDQYTSPTSVTYTVHLSVSDFQGQPVEYPPVPMIAVQGTVDYTMLLSQV